MLFDGGNVGKRTPGSAFKAAPPKKPSFVTPPAYRAPTPKPSGFGHGPMNKAPRPIAPPPPPPPPPAPVAFGGGGGGGGGGAAPAAVPAPPPRISLDDFIKKNFLYTSAQNEGERRLDDFDAGTTRMTQETGADQGVRRSTLQRQLADLGQGNAEDMAGRGLGRSGMTFGNQDRINEQGVQQESIIEQMMTDLLKDRGQGRIGQQAANRGALNETISKLTDQYNNQSTTGLTAR